MPAAVTRRHRLDAGRLAEAYELLALSLARAMADLGQADAVEARMVAIVDPIYDTMDTGAACWRLVDFCDGVRRITGLPYSRG